MLVSPIRCVPRLADLTPEEISDLFISVQKVQCVMEQIQNVCSSTIAVQDGEHAGQTIKVCAYTALKDEQVNKQWLHCRHSSGVQSRSCCSKTCILSHCCGRKTKVF